MAMIKFTFQNAESMRQELDNLNQMFLNKVDEMSSTELALNSMWQGSANQAFHQNFLYDVEQMHNFSKVIDSYIKALEIAAHNYKIADQYHAQGISFASLEDAFQQIDKSLNEYMNGIGTKKYQESLLQQPLRLDEVEDEKISSIIRRYMEEDLGLSFSDSTTMRRMLEHIIELAIPAFPIWNTNSEYSASCKFIPNKQEHYNRNIYNEVPENIQDIFTIDEDGNVSGCDEGGWRMLSESQSVYHRNTHGEQGMEALYNYKFLKDNPDGSSSEVIICVPPGKDSSLVTDPFNAGTFNYGSPSSDNPMSYVEHFTKDMIPYWLWGNQEVDGGLENAFFRVTGHYASDLADDLMDKMGN